MLMLSLTTATTQKTHLKYINEFIWFLYIVHPAITIAQVHNAMSMLKQYVVQPYFKT